jgi:predicted DCC family thiol-disulfide oxidoreductase YuxK
VSAKRDREPHGILVFDGRCGMCTRVCNRLAELNRTGRLQIEPFQTPGMAERLGVADDRLSESAWWLDSSGAVFAGAQALNAALSAARGTRLPLRIYSLPGIGALQNALYRWVAAHRYRFRGVTPLCEAEPHRCS